MKRVIPDNRVESLELLSKDIVSTQQIREHDIVVVDSYSAVGLLTNEPTGNWFVTDILNGCNLWAGSHSPTIHRTLNVFGNSSSHNIWKFDDKQEFVRWLAKRILNINLDKKPRQRDSKGRFIRSL